MLRVSNVAESADIVPCLRELHDEASIVVNLNGGFADSAAQHSEFITGLVVLSARPTERLLQESLKLVAQNDGQSLQELRWHGLRHNLTVQFRVAEYYDRRETACRKRAIQ